MNLIRSIGYYLLFGLLVTPLTLLSQVLYGDNTLAGKYLQTRGFRLYYETYGQGAPLLLIHGNSGSIASMKDQIPYFSKRYKVIAADSRSQGKSADPSDSLSYEMMADDLNALLDSLHTGPVNIIGWSDGGIIGLLMAVRHPEKVRKLAITGANIRPDSSAIPAADIRSLREYVVSLRARITEPDARNRIKLNAMMLDQPNITAFQLRMIRCPVLVIGGDHDMIKPEHTLEIFRSIPGARLWILPGSGHDTCIRFRDDFNEQVGRFFLE